MKLMIRICKISGNYYNKSTMYVIYNTLTQQSKTNGNNLI